MVSRSSPDSHSEKPGFAQDVERYGHIIRLKPEYRERYVVLHAHPFPAIIDRMREAGLQNYSIFLREQTLFSYYEYVGNDFEADMEAMAENSSVQDWWTLTDPMQEPLEGRDEGEWWASMEELYHSGPKTVRTEEADRRAFVRQFQKGGLEEGREVYAEMGGELEPALEHAQVQNYTVYRLGRRCFTYLEYAGRDLETDLGRLRESTEMQRLREALDPLTVSLAPSARDPKHPGMESVFFMA